MGTLFLKLVGVIATALGTRLVNAIFNALDWYPMRWLVGRIMDAPTENWVEVARWGLATFVAVTIWGILYICKRQSKKSHDASKTTNRVPLTTLREWAIKAGWKGDVHSNTDEINNLYQFKTRLRQAAVDARIQFWGRKYPYHIPESMKANQPLVAISPSHFEEFDFDVIELAERCNYDIFTHKIGYLLQDLKDRIFRDLYVDSEQARNWLGTNGAAPPAASFHAKLDTSDSRIGDYEVICAVTIKNLEERDLNKCLVQMEQLSGWRPSNMPFPLVLRTESQIRDKRKGRFLLSSGQPKTIPFLFRDLMRKNEWFLFDENGESYFVPPRQLGIVIGIYGGKANGKALIEIDIEGAWRPLPKISAVPDDFALDESSSRAIGG